MEVLLGRTPAAPLLGWLSDHCIHWDVGGKWLLATSCIRQLVPQHVRRYSQQCQHVTTLPAMTAHILAAMQVLVQPPQSRPAAMLANMC
jgi:hypothetical protein